MKGIKRIHGSKTNVVRWTENDLEDFKKETLDQKKNLYSGEPQRRETNWSSSSHDYFKIHIDTTINMKTCSIGVRAIIRNIRG